MDKTRLIKMAAIAAVILGIWNSPIPTGLEAETWHIVALYLGLLMGLVLRPFSEPVVALIIVGIASMFIKSSILLHGYGNDMAWFIAMVTIVCTAFIKTGLGKRIAYNLLIRAGNTTLGLGYIMVITDLILSPATGSNSSRTSIIYPIFQNIAQGIGSTAEKAPRKLGAFLEVLMYTSSQTTSALFLTGMATNAITVSLMSEMLDIHLTWGLWVLASAVPVGLILLLAPLVIYKIYPPEMKSLSEVKPLAMKGLEELGPMSSAEKRLLGLFILAILGWMFGPLIPFVNLKMQYVGFVFLALVLITNVLDWNDVIAAKGAWNIFVWYGAFYGIAAALSSAGFYTWLADYIGNVVDLSVYSGMTVTAVLVFVSLAVRYFFVSNSAFVASFYPVLFILALGTQANPMVVGLLLAFCSPLGALLTHYGNGAGLITFASGYVPQKDFWRVGTTMVAMSLVILFGVGIPYWKLVGLW